MLASRVSAVVLMSLGCGLGTIALPTSSFAQATPSIASVRAAILNAISSAQAANAAQGVTGPAAAENIRAAIQQAVIAINAPPGIVQAALSSLPANVTRQAGVSAAVASVQASVQTAVAQSAAAGIAAASAPLSAPASFSAPPASAGGGGGGGSDYRG